MEAATNSASINAGPINTNGFDAIQVVVLGTEMCNRSRKRFRKPPGGCLHCKQKWHGSLSGNDTSSTV